MSAARILSPASLLAGVLLSSAAQSATPTLTTVYSFHNTDGGAPRAGLIEHAGVFYGTTTGGGRGSEGTVYSFDPATSVETVLHGFSGADGEQPWGPLLYRNGRLYGLTFVSGTTGTGGGVVYEVNLSNGKEQALYTFGTDGYECFSALTLYAGKLLGTCAKGGAANGGLAFMVDPITKVESTVHSFTNGRDGDYPQTDLAYVNGYFYGATYMGGTAGAGTLFSINATTGEEKVIYNFPGGSGGNGPDSSLTYADGALYGNTILGGNNDKGTVFKFDLSTGTNTVLYRFAGGEDGDQPGFEPPLYVNGKLYGTTYGGGTTQDPYGYGTIYTIDVTTGAEQVVYRFTGGADGAYPTGRLLYKDGKFYGVTNWGGASNYGSIFSFSMQ